jgi:hypothetical protein
VVVWFFMQAPHASTTTYFPDFPDRYLTLVRDN